MKHDPDLILVAICTAAAIILICALAVVLGGVYSACDQRFVGWSDTGHAMYACVGGR